MRPTKKKKVIQILYNSIATNNLNIWKSYFLIIKKEKDDLKETTKKQNSLTKFLYEVVIEELDEVEEKIKDTIIKTMDSFIENNDFFVKELETDDYFYGLEDSKDE